jgi:sugar O-acyltransferase (sialic acid O-acetyltransferase NeuD family)
MKSVIIFGIGDTAECVHYYLTNDSEYNVAAFTVDKEYMNGSTFHGLPVVPFDEVNKVFPPEEYDMFIAVGFTGLNSDRTKRYHEAKNKGYKLISYISSKAIVWKDLKIGENCLVLESSVIHPFVTIEDNVTIWSGNLISHHTHISKNCFISAHVVIAGGVVIEENCFLGVNSTVREHVKIAKNCIIGANSLILKDTKENGAYITGETKLNRLPSSMLKPILLNSK